MNICNKIDDLADEQEKVIRTDHFRKDVIPLRFCVV